MDSSNISSSIMGSITIIKARLGREGGESGFWVHDYTLHLMAFFGRTYIQALGMTSNDNDILILT